MNLREKLLKSSQDALDAIKVPFQVRKDKKSLESWIITKEEEIATLELKLQEKKSSKSFDADGILDMQDDLALVKRRLKQGQQLLKEMFEENVSE